jgi:DnaJ-class molecular chaperone
MGLERMPNGRTAETRVEQENCPTCNGKGVIYYKDEVTCPRCSGTGKRPSAR